MKDKYSEEDYLKEETHCAHEGEIQSKFKWVLIGVSLANFNNDDILKFNNDFKFEKVNPI